jgi:hypothetical protein
MKHYSFCGKQKSLSIVTNQFISLCLALLHIRDIRKEVFLEYSHFVASFRKNNIEWNKIFKLIQEEPTILLVDSDKLQIYRRICSKNLIRRITKKIRRTETIFLAIYGQLCLC